MVGEMEIIVILDVTDSAAQLPATSVEVWALASLPRDVQAGDQVGVTVTDSDLACELLERRGGLQA